MLVLCGFYPFPKPAEATQAYVHDHYWPYEDIFLIALLDFCPTSCISNSYFHARRQEMHN